MTLVLPPVVDLNCVSPPSILKIGRLSGTIRESNVHSFVQSHHHCALSLSVLLQMMGPLSSLLKRRTPGSVSRSGHLLVPFDPQKVAVVEDFLSAFRKVGDFVVVTCGVQLPFWTFQWPPSLGIYNRCFHHFDLTFLRRSIRPKMISLVRSSSLALDWSHDTHTPQPSRENCGFS